MPEFDGLPWIDGDQFYAWRMRVCAERAARNLSWARAAALTALLGLMSDGNTEVADAEVAKLACCSVRTVRRARADARELGLLQWSRTRALVDGAWRQGRNRYVVTVPNRPVCPRPPRPQADRMAAPVRFKIRKEAQEAQRTVPTVPAHIAAASLEAIRTQRARQLGVSG